MVKIWPEKVAYISFLLFAILLTPFAGLWISTILHGAVSIDSWGGLFMMGLMLLPVVFALFGLTFIVLVKGPPHLRIRTGIWWASVLLTFLVANFPPRKEDAAVMSLIGLIGFCLALSLPIIWMVKTPRLRDDEVTPQSSE
jgi:hypothetical protein